MAKKGTGQRIGGAFIEIGGDNTGLKDTLDDSLRSVTGAVGAIAAIGKGGGVGGAVAALGPPAIGLAATAAVVDAAVKQQDTLAALARQVGRQGGTGEDFQSIFRAMASATVDRPVSISDLIPTMISAFKAGGLNPRDRLGIDALLKETIGGAFATGADFNQVGQAFIDAQARGQMGGLISAGFQGINPDPRFTEENLRRARNQAFAGLQAEEAESGSFMRRIRSFFSNVSGGLTIAGQGMAGAGGGLTLKEATDVANVTFGQATGLSAAERRTGVGGLQENNPAFGKFPGAQQEDIDLLKRVQPLLDREPAMREPALVQPSGPLSERADEQIGLLQQIRDNTAREQRGMSIEEADAIAREQMYEGFIEKGATP